MNMREYRRIFYTCVQTWPFKGAVGDRGLLECTLRSCPEGMAVAAAFWMECGEGGVGSIEQEPGGRRASRGSGSVWSSLDH